MEVGEIWKDIPNYEGLYQVSNLGNIKSLFRYKKILKPIKNTLGYLKVSLYKNKKIKVFSIHRLVAETFIQNPNNLPEINHKDGNKGNNNEKQREYHKQYKRTKQQFKNIEYIVEE